jgi:nucleoside-diphosphate-sugar epimerase
VIGDRLVYNIGRHDNLVTMRHVAEMAVEITGSKSKIVLVDIPPGIATIKDINCVRIRDLGWEPTTDLRLGMSITASWLALLTERIVAVRDHSSPQEHAKYVFKRIRPE